MRMYSQLAKVYNSLCEAKPIQCKGSRMQTKTIALTLSAAAFLLAQVPATYHVTHTYTLGGDGSWDYVVPDPPNHRLFIARQTRVMVVRRRYRHAAR